MDPFKYIQLIFDQGAEAIQWRKDSVFKTDTQPTRHRPWIIHKT